MGRRRAAPVDRMGDHADHPQPDPRQRQGRSLRCWSGGSCDAQLRRGGIVLGVPAQEHAAYVGERGGGVPVDPARLTPDLPGRRTELPGLAERRPRAADPRQGDTQRNDADGRADMPSLPRIPVRRSSSSAIRNAGDSEGEIFLGEAPIKSDATGRVDVFHDGQRAAQQRPDLVHRHDDDDRRRDLGIQPAGRDVGLSSTRVSWRACSRPRASSA